MDIKECNYGVIYQKHVCRIYIRLPLSIANIFHCDVMADVPIITEEYVNTLPKKDT